MNDKILTYIFLTLCALFLIGTFRTYLRTELKGELLRTIGIVILLVSYLISDSILGMIIGFVIFNIGWIMLVTVENDKQREIFRQTTIIDRLIGNVPIMRHRKDFPDTYKKGVGILTGIICLLISFIFLKKLKTFEVGEITFIGILIMAGIFFIVYSLIKGKYFFRK